MGLKNAFALVICLVVVWRAYLSTGVESYFFLICNYVSFYEAEKFHGLGDALGEYKNINFCKSFYRGLLMKSVHGRHCHCYDNFS